MIPKKVTWTIGPYLIIHTLFLSTLAFITWLAPDFKSFVKFIPFITELSLPDGKFLVFQQTIVAACCAGLGGGVFMIKRFFIEYAYGVKHKQRQLSPIDIPQFIFLPISSVIIGPLSLCLLKAGSIAFEGFSGKGQVPLFTVIALSFIMGLSYYDTLHAFCERSKRIFWKDNDSLEEGKKMKPLSEELIQLNMEIYDAMNKRPIEEDDLKKPLATDFTFSNLQNPHQDSTKMIQEFKGGKKESEWPIDVNGGIIDDYGVVTTIIKVKGDSEKYYHIKLFNRQQSEDWKCVYWRVTKSNGKNQVS